ncbi:Unknown protein, partial [Striga hermonthica]
RRAAINAAINLHHRLLPCCPSVKSLIVTRSSPSTTSEPSVSRRAPLCTLDDLPRF